MALAATEAPSTLQWGEYNDSSQEPIDGDIPVARATLQLVAVYRHLHEVVPQTLPPSAVRSFHKVCDSLCSALIDMDDLTEILWGGSA